MKSFLGVTYILILGELISCRSSSSPQVTSTTPSLPAGEVEIIVPCAGAEYTTSTEALRASSIGESIDQSVAKRKALSNARMQLAAAIETTIKGVADSYVLSDENNQNEMLKERYESFSREVVQQELRGVRMICEKFTRTSDGKYKAYVTLELSVQSLANTYFKNLTQIQQTSSNPKYEDFQKVFIKEMVEGSTP